MAPKVEPLHTPVKYQAAVGIHAKPRQISSPQHEDPNDKHSESALPLIPEAPENSYKKEIEMLKKEIDHKNKILKSAKGKDSRNYNKPTDHEDNFVGSEMANPDKDSSEVSSEEESDTYPKKYGAQSKDYRHDYDTNSHDKKRNFYTPELYSYPKDTKDLEMNRDRTPDLYNSSEYQKTLEYFRQLDKYKLLRSTRNQAPRYSEYYNNPEYFPKLNRLSNPSPDYQMNPRNVKSEILTESSKDSSNFTNNPRPNPKEVYSLSPYKQPRAQPEKNALIDKELYDKMQERDKKKKTFENIQLQLAEKERIKQQKLEKKERAIAKRMEELKRIKEDEEKARLERIERIKNYKADLEVQKKLNERVLFEEKRFSATENPPVDNFMTENYDEGKLVFNPLTGELKDISKTQFGNTPYYDSPIIPFYKNQARLPSDFAAVPAFQQPKFTRNHPKVMLSHPITGPQQIRSVNFQNRFFR